MRPLWLFLIMAAARAAAAPAAAEAALQDQIRRAKETILPKTVYIHVVGQDFDRGESKRQIWTGSGVIISTDGYAITNHHVVDSAKRVRVMLSDRTSYEADVIGSDEETDLGLIKLRRPAGAPPLPAAELGRSSKLSAGDFVLAVGSPLGLTRSVSLGIVNNPNQLLSSGDLYNWIQIDAAINPGNSGGPLVDLAGRVVGINTAGYLGTGLGFAIPSDLAREIVQELKLGGRIVRGLVGIQLQALRDFDRDSYMDEERGLLISGVEPDTPAVAAGVKDGDLLLAVDGRRVDAAYPEDLPAVRRVFAALPPGKPVKLSLRRDGAALELTVVPRERRKAEAEDKGRFEAPEWMLTVQEIREDEESLQKYFRPKGCFVIAAKPNGNAARSGVEANDILLDADGREILSLADLRSTYEASLAKAPADRLILLTVLRNGRTHKLALDYTRSRESHEEER
ncbi:MAG: trypsin-like peptidase domain-containing protein [Elusimicrobiota bacterium]|nr:MAG: trypsin-like peptidase domain-containing protein [Elusimicrobiota bacterium]